ncbi:hypothetical protein RJ60_13625 [Mesotoga sp. B105.6.4]|nr:hypothetical protein RJ60_13625 [Mesotoga sp. B105.6.4]
MLYRQAQKKGRKQHAGVRVWSLGFGEKRRFALQSSRDQFFEPIEGRVLDPGRRTKDVPSQLIASLSKRPVILMEPVSPYLRAACRYAFKTRSRAGSSRDDPEQVLFRAGY